jgi:hypothetical protein
MKRTPKAPNKEGQRQYPEEILELGLKALDGGMGESERGVRVLGGCEQHGQRPGEGTSQNIDHSPQAMLGFRTHPEWEGSQHH